MANRNRRNPPGGNRSPPPVYLDRRQEARLGRLNEKLQELIDLEASAKQRNDRAVEARRELEEAAETAARNSEITVETFAHANCLQVLLGNSKWSGRVVVRARQSSDQHRLTTRVREIVGDFPEADVEVIA